MHLSQAKFAEAIRAAGNAMGAPNYCTKRLVQKWETGEHATCRDDYLRVLQAVTGLSARELGFPMVQHGEARPSAAASSGEHPGSAGGSPYAGDAARAAAVVVAVSEKTDYSSPVMIEGSMNRLRYAVNHPSTVDLRAAELVEMATARLFDLEHHSPARLLAPTVDRHLGTVTALLTAARHDVVRRKLTESAGAAALLAGWLAFDRGDTASAHRFWDDSISAAQGTVHDELFAASLIHQSYAAGRRGDPGTAWQLAHAASSCTLDDPRAIAWAVARVALYTAQLGERKVAEAAMQRSLEIGEDLPSPAPGDGGMPWTRSFDRALLLSSTAHAAALLRHPKAAEYATHAVDALGTVKVKARAVVLAEAALTAAIVGDFKLCLDYGSIAAATTRDLDVSIAADLLHEVVPAILPYSDTRAVRELLPQLTMLTRSADRERGVEQEKECTAD